MKLVPLKALGSIYTGNTPSKKERKFYEAKDIPFIKPDIISDSKLSEITHTEEYISNLARNNARIIPKNSILVTCIGSIGKIGITGPGEYAFNQQINAIVPNAGINVRYLAYCLLFNKKKLCEIANNAVVPIINKKQFSDFCVSINPDIKVQKDIVRTLDILACIIKHRQSQLAKLDELVKCRFVEMFGDWKTNPLNLPQISGKELFVFSSGKFLSSDKRKECGVPVYGGNGIAWYTDKPLIQESTIIIGRVGAFCGNIHSTKQPVWITDNAIYIKHCKKEIDHVFLTELMTQMDFHQYADFSGQPKITQKPLEETKYILPTLEQQNAFASFVHRIDKLRKLGEERRKMGDKRRNWVSKH